MPGSRGRASAYGREGILVLAHLTITMFSRRWLAGIYLALTLGPMLVIGLVLSSSGASYVIWIVLAAFLLVPLVVPAMLLIPLGWNANARTFPLPKPEPRSPVSLDQPAGPKWRDEVTSVALRYKWLSLNNCVAWASDHHAITLAMAFPFNLGTRAIQVPWSAVQSLRPVEGLLGDLCEIQTTPPLPAPIYVPSELVAEEIKRRGTAAR